MWPNRLEKRAPRLPGKRYNRYWGCVHDWPYDCMLCRKCLVNAMDLSHSATRRAAIREAGKVQAERARAQRLEG